MQARYFTSSIGGRVVRVSDVATIGWAQQEPTHVACFNGKRAVFVNDGAIVLATGADETSLVKLSAPVFTELTTRLPGDVRPHVLAAVGAAWALGVPPDLIRASLLHFCEVQAAPAVH